MHLFLVRHGETQWNLEGRLQGRHDSPLTEKGLAQVELLKNFFSDKKIDSIYSSTLGRAVATAQAIAVSKNLPFRQVHALDEIAFGMCEGLTKKEIDGIFPELWEKRHEDKYNFRIPSGESYADVFRRAKKFLDESEKKHSSQTILIVAHGCINRAIIKYFTNLPEKEIADLGVPHKFLYEIEENGIAKIFHINIENGKKEEGVLPSIIMEGKND